MRAKTKSEKLTQAMEAEITPPAPGGVAFEDGPGGFQPAGAFVTPGAIEEAAAVTGIDFAQWESADVAASTMTGDLVRAALDEVRSLPRPWARMSEKEQSEVIDRLTKRLAAAVNEAVAVIAARDCPRIHAEVVSISAKRELSATLKIGKDDRQRHALLDNVGKMVLIVIPAAEQYQGGTEQNQPDPDQPPLFDPDAGNDEDPDHDSGN